MIKYYQEKKPACRPAVYIAGPWARKDTLHAAHGYAERHGVRLVSTWTTQSSDDGAYSEEDLWWLAQRDWIELMSADVLILLSLGVLSEGKATEVGAMLARGKRVIHVREDRERLHNLFLRLPQVTHVSTFAQAVRLVL